MFREAGQAPGVVRAQLVRNAAAVARLAAQLRRSPPPAVITCARGSSDHAATYARYLFETRMGLLTSSAAPSVTSVYGARPQVRGCLFLVISQSGRSPDLLESAQAAREGGAHVVALVNDERSPLAGLAEHVLPLGAGAEESVAATKTYIAALAAITHLAAEWLEDAALGRALQSAPEDLERAWHLDWSAALALMDRASSLYVIARGVGLAAAQEAALKCKETCGLHAESFSAAEVRHGPQALLAANFPALILAQDDEARPGLEALARELAQRGVPLACAGIDVEGAFALPSLAAHPAIQPMLQVQSFYRVANALALARGMDPDAPPHLTKVTHTQ
jgi:glucosamine--fructose-6-phosphate aminotransferase (isomerizing)